MHDTEVITSASAFSYSFKRRRELTYKDFVPSIFDWFYFFGGRGRDMWSCLSKTGHDTRGISRKFWCFKCFRIKAEMRSTCPRLTHFFAETWCKNLTFRHFVGATSTQKFVSDLQNSLFRKPKIGGILRLPTCKINHVKMQHNFSRMLTCWLN